MRSKHRRHKATNKRITPEYLKDRAEAVIKLGYTKQKWVEFCEVMLSHGFTIELYEARRTFSKYLTVIEGGKRYKVRFSNHKPIRERELNGDCDFFVGRTNLAVHTTTQAIAATLKFFGKDKTNA